jgi:DNA-binding GntR family transcriptional regulator
VTATRTGLSVRKAVDELAAEHLVVRRQGKGTFVATHHEARAQYRFLRVVPDEGDPVPAVSRVLECRRVRAHVRTWHACSTCGPRTRLSTSAAC